MSFSYLFDPNKQFQGRDGLNLVAGVLRVYLDGTDDHATTYKNFDGGLNENDIVLDNDGRAVVIVDSSMTYRLEVRDRSGDLLWTTTGLVPGGGYIDEGISGLNYNDEAEAHKFVTSVSEANGVISVERRQPAIGDVDGLQTELYGKESTSNKKQSIDPTSTTEYPSSKAVADAIAASRDTLKGINFYLEGASEPFAEYSPTANADTDVHIPVNVWNSAILEWDGTSRLYDDIEELVDAGKMVFIKTDRYYYTLIETTAAGRFCFVSMPTYYVVYYLEFYPSAHPTGFSETTFVNATIKFFNSPDSDETIWTGTSVNARNLNVYEDTNKERYISGGFVGDTITFYNMNPDSKTLAYAFTRSGTLGNYTYSELYLFTHGNQGATIPHCHVCKDILRVQRPEGRARRSCAHRQFRADCGKHPEGCGIRNHLLDRRHDSEREPEQFLLDARARNGKAERRPHQGGLPHHGEQRVGHGRSYADHIGVRHEQLKRRRRFFRLDELRHLAGLRADLRDGREHEARREDPRHERRAYSHH